MCQLHLAKAGTVERKSIWWLSFALKQQSSLNCISTYYSFQNLNFHCNFALLWWSLQRSREGGGGSRRQAEQEKKCFLEELRKSQKSNSCFLVKSWQMFLTYSQILADYSSWRKRDEAGRHQYIVVEIYCSSGLLTLKKNFGCGKKKPKVWFLQSDWRLSQGRRQSQWHSFLLESGNFLLTLGSKIKVQKVRL